VIDTGRPRDTDLTNGDVHHLYLEWDPFDCKHDDHLPRWGRVGDIWYPIIFIGKMVKARAYESDLMDGRYFEKAALRWRDWYWNFAESIRERQAVAVVRGDWKCVGVHAVMEVRNDFPLVLKIGERLLELKEEAQVAGSDQRRVQ
jgi:hypothetical protein